MSATVRVHVTGETLSVHIHGEGRPLLFVHGFPFDHAMWARQVEALAQWRCIAPDLRGAGASDAPDQAYSVGRYADDLVAVLDALDAPRAACCAHSMGGYILFELLRRHPERIAALILCCTKAEPDTPDGKRGRDELIALARNQGVAPVVERLLPKLLGASTRATRPALVDEVRAAGLRQPLRGITGALTALRDRPDSTDTLATIRVPTLVMGGAEDEIAPPAVMRAMAQRIAAARWVEVGGVGHVAPLEQPDVVNQEIGQFLAELTV